MKTGPKERTKTGAKIVKLLKDGKLSLHEIADKLNVTPNAVRYYKRMLRNGSTK